MLTVCTTARLDWTCNSAPPSRWRRCRSVQRPQPQRGSGKLLPSRASASTEDHRQFTTTLIAPAQHRWRIQIRCEAESAHIVSMEWTFWLKVGCLFIAVYSELELIEHAPSLRPQEKTGALLQRAFYQHHTVHCSITTVFIVQTMPCFVGCVRRCRWHGCLCKVWCLWLSCILQETPTKQRNRFSVLVSPEVSTQCIPPASRRQGTELQALC